MATLVQSVDDFQRCQHQQQPSALLQHLGGKAATTVAVKHVFDEILFYYNYIETNMPSDTEDSSAPSVVTGKMADLRLDTHLNQVGILLHNYFIYFN